MVQIRSTYSIADRLESVKESFLPASLEYSLTFLAESQNAADGGWGRLKGGASEVRETGIALLALLTCGYEKLVASCEEGLQYLVRNIQPDGGGKGQLQTGLSIFDISLVVQVVAMFPGDRYVDELKQIVSALRKNQNTDGSWGANADTIEYTAAVIIALSNQGELSEDAANGIAFLLSSQNADGGWGPTKGLPSTISGTAQALRALAAAHYAVDTPAFQKGRRYLEFSQKSGGGWGDIDEANVYHTSLAVLALVSCEVGVGSILLQTASEFLRALQNGDGGWGWKSGEVSQTEPTGYALLALVNSGVNQYVPLATALSVLEGVTEETTVLKQQLRRLEQDIDARVEERIPNVIEERNKLQTRVKELSAASDRLRLEQERRERLEADIEAIRHRSRYALDYYESVVTQGREVRRQFTIAGAALMGYAALASASVILLAWRAVTSTIIIVIAGILNVLVATGAALWMRRLSRRQPYASDIMSELVSTFLEPEEMYRREYLRPRPSRRELEFVFDRLKRLMLMAPPSEREMVWRLLRDVVHMEPSDRRSYVRFSVETRLDFAPDSWRREFASILDDILDTGIPGSVLERYIMRLMRL